MDDGRYVTDYLNMFIIFTTEQTHRSYRRANRSIQYTIIIE